MDSGGEKMVVVQDVAAVGDLHVRVHPLIARVIPEREPHRVAAIVWIRTIQADRLEGIKDTLSAVKVGHVLRLMKNQPSRTKQSIDGPLTIEGDNFFVVNVDGMPTVMVCRQRCDGDTYFWELDLPERAPRRGDRIISSGWLREEAA